MEAAIHIEPSEPRAGRRARPILRWAAERQERARPAAGYLVPASRLARAWQLLCELPKNLFLYVFRAAPYPVTPGLLVVGNPDRSSPVLITANYELTVRRVARGLLGMDCWLLVAPTGGINVWCAAGDGHFSIDSIVSILKTSGIAGRVDHRRLLLPELCGNGINMFEVKRRTGWTAVFGPARAEDVPEYYRRGRKKPRRMLRVTFTPAERLEMALAMWGSLTLRFALFPLVLGGWIVAGAFAAFVALLSVAVSFGCFVLPGKTFVQKAGVAGLVLLAGVLGVSAGFGIQSWTFGGTQALLILMAAFLVGSAFPGYSPYWQCNYSKLFFGSPNLDLRIVEQGCIGCKICDEVCPVDCFAPTDHNTYELIRPELCEGCMACVINCPTDTIINEVAVQHRLETAQG